MMQIRGKETTVEPAQSDDGGRAHPVVKVAGTWGYGVVIAILAFIPGLMGSTHAEAIRSAAPFCCVIGMDSYIPGRMKAAPVPVFMFWTSAILWLGLFTLRQVADSAAVKQAQAHAAELKDAVDKTKGTAEQLVGDVGKAKTDLEAAVANTRSNLTTHVTDTSQRIDHHLADAKASLGDAVVETKSRIEQNILEASKHAQKINDTIVATTGRLEAAAGATQSVLDQVHRDVQTLPPKSYLPVLAEHTVLAHHGIPWGTTPTTRACMLMLSVVQLARAYDSRMELVRYAANVMRFWPNPSREFSDTMATIRPPLPTAFGPDDLAGVLVLDEDLTVSLDSVDTHDERVSKVAFGIPRDLEAGKALLFPGAPKAFAFQRAVRPHDALVYTTSDLQQVPAMMRTSGVFGDSDVLRMEGLFGAGSVQGQWVRSGLSFPLFVREHGAGGSVTPVGVLNIHCDKSNPLGSDLGDDKRYAFAVTIQHFVELVAESLWL